MPVTRALLQQFRILVTKTFQNANKSLNFMGDIARQLKSTLTQTLESNEADYIIASYLIAQIQGLGESNSKSDYARTLVQSFFKALTIPLQPKTQIQFEDIIKSIIEMPGETNVVANLWKEGARTYDCYCGEEDVIIMKDNSEQLCYKCGRCCHTACFWPKEPTQRYFQCPVCYLTSCFPHKPVDEIFFVGFLKADERAKVSHKLKFQIDMKRLELQNVEIRCVRLNQKSRFEITFPQNCTISLGGQELQKFLPLSDTSPLKRRNDAQIHINKYDLTYLNTLIINENYEYLNGLKKRDNHLIVIVSARPYLNQEKIVKECMGRRLSSQNSKLMLQEYMNKNQNECQVEKINVSLQCQYYGTHIKDPARSIQCTTHYQPFDLTNFIHASLNSKNSVQKWKCPICKKRAFDLVVDEYILSLIQSKGNISDICFNRQGQPVLIQEKIESESQESVVKQKINRKEEEINIGKQVFNNQIIEIEESQGQQRERIAITRHKKFQDQRVNVIQIGDSDEEKEVTENIIKDKRTLSERQADIHEESETEKLRKIIPKGSQLTEIRQDKQQASKPLKPQSTDIIDKSAALDKIRGKFKELFASKGQPINEKNQVIESKQKKLQKTKEFQSMRMQKSKVKTIPREQRENQMVDVDVQVIDDEDDMENKSTGQELRLIQDQRTLLERARRALTKGPLTKIDQLAFNRICGQINNLKITN